MAGKRKLGPAKTQMGHKKENSENLAGVFAGESSYACGCLEGVDTSTRGGRFCSLVGRDSWRPVCTSLS